MKTPIVQETRRAGQTAKSPPVPGSQAALVARSLAAVPDTRPVWDERTRTEHRRAA